MSCKSLAIYLMNSGKNNINELACVKTWTVALAPRLFLWGKAKNIVVWPASIFEDECLIKKMKKDRKHIGSWLYFKVLDTTRQYAWKKKLYFVLTYFSWTLCLSVFESSINSMRAIHLYFDIKCCAHRHIHIMSSYTDRPDFPKMLTWCLNSQKLHINVFFHKVTNYYLK
jgi:hypothetical protein